MAECSKTDTNPKAKVKKRSVGIRCMAFGCDNTSQSSSYSVHEMPGKMPAAGAHFTPLQKAWIDFIGKRRKFDSQHARTYRKIILCSGHFTESQYIETELQMYKRGFRKKTPSLKKDAKPTLDTAAPPFPPSWFIPKALSTLPQQDLQVQAPMIVPMETTSVSSLLHATSSSSTLPSPRPSTLATEPEPVTVTPMLSEDIPFFPHEVASEPGAKADDDTLPDFDSHQKPKRRRSESKYIRKKDIKGMLKEYTRKAEEQKSSEKTKDILDRSKGEQCSVKMKDHKVGHRTKQRTCRVQVKPSSTVKGTQADICSKPAFPVAVIYCDASSQTIESSFIPAVEEEAEMEDDFEEVEEEEDDEDRDPSYMPGANSSDEEVQKVFQPANVVEEEKFIVFETNLLELFKTCINCLSQNVTIQKIRPKCYGSQLKVIGTCNSCNHKREWWSQPKVGTVMAGNLLLSAAILFGGASPTKVLRLLNFMNLQVISTSTFMDHQSTYLQPAICRIFTRQQRQLQAQIPEGEKLVLGGDGRCDSPGHSAKYGSYALMDMKRKKIIDIQLVQSNEVGSSNAMEKEGLARGLSKVQEMGIGVSTLITDRHGQVAKWMRDTHPDITHQYDVWHIAKGIKKKITALSKLKDCELAQLWKRSIVNHVYWCASSTPDGNGEVMLAKYKSVLNHIRNVHDHHDTPAYPKCEHAEDYPQREWMKEGTKVFEKLSEEVLKTRLMNDVKRMSPLAQTSSVESFHSVLLYWCPKMLAYSYAGMKCRLYLAALHWNENANRGQATKADGTPRFSITFPKAKEGRHSVSKVLTACTFHYVEALMMETVHLVSGRHKIRQQIPALKEKPALCSAFDRPEKEEAIKQAQEHRRFTMN